MKKIICIFALILYGCTRSSMDRIPDSGSDDMGSIPIGCTKDFLRCGGVYI